MGSVVRDAGDSERSRARVEQRRWTTLQEGTSGRRTVLGSYVRHVWLLDYIYTPHYGGEPRGPMRQYVPIIFHLAPPYARPPAPVHRLRTVRLLAHGRATVSTLLFVARRLPLFIFPSSSFFTLYSRCFFHRPHSVPSPWPLLLLQPRDSSAQLLLRETEVFSPRSPQLLSLALLLLPTLGATSFCNFVGSRALLSFYFELFVLRWDVEVTVVKE